MLEDDIGHDPILIRTFEGQKAAFDDLMLDDGSRRLLRLVNGYTPLSSLAPRLDREGDGDRAAGDLLRRGLVAGVPD